MAKIKTESTDDVFARGQSLARDSAESWFSFKSVGDKVGGFIRDMFETPAKGLFKAQRVFTIEQPDGVLVNVGLKRTNYTLTRTNELQIGDELGIKFEKEIPAKVKGMHPAKSLTFVSVKHGDRMIGEQAKDMTVTASVEDADTDEITEDDMNI